MGMALFDNITHIVSDIVVFVEESNMGNFALYNVKLQGQ
jgi:hypothetical protein